MKFYSISSMASPAQMREGFANVSHILEGDLGEQGARGRYSVCPCLESSNSVDFADV